MCFRYTFYGTSVTPYSLTPRLSQDSGTFGLHRPDPFQTQRYLPCPWDLYLLGVQTSVNPKTWLSLTHKDPHNVQSQSNTLKSSKKTSCSELRAAARGGRKLRLIDFNASTFLKCWRTVFWPCFCSLGSTSTTSRTLLIRDGLALWRGHLNLRERSRDYRSNSRFAITRALAASLSMKYNSYCYFIICLGM